MLAAELDTQSLEPTWQEEKTDSHKLSSDIHKHAHVHTYANNYVNVIQFLNVSLRKSTSGYCFEVSAHYVWF